MYIFALILILLGIAALFIGSKQFREAPDFEQRRRGEPGAVITWTKPVARIVGIGFIIVGIIVGAFTVTYVQDPGEAKVQVSWTGEIVGQSTQSGIHTKAPWVTLHTFNIRNQTVNYVDSANNDKVADRTGPYITVQDKDGVSSNIALNLQYTIDAKSVSDIYTTYKDEETFKAQFVSNSVRSVVRSVPNKFTTIELITSRGEVEKAMTKALEEKWKGSGVHLDNLNLQEINTPKSVRDSYAQAQQAQIEVEKEKANLEAQQVKAQQQVQSAEAQAKANKVLNANPLSDAALKQKEIEALRAAGEAGSLIVVPSDGNNILSLPTPTK